MVDGEGLTVYPGLIDALSTVGMPGAAPAGAASVADAADAAAAAPRNYRSSRRRGTCRERARGPEDRPSTTSWLKVADEIQATDRRIETVRGAGFTTAVTFPTRGIFAGQGSVIDLLSGEKAGEMVLVPRSASTSHSRAAVGRIGGGFPSALMGTISYIRQIYLDADHYQLVKDAYAKDPRGMQRPEYDRALEGVLESKRILLPANRLVEIDRMLRFAAELKQPTILYGVREAYRPEAAELLKKSGTSGAGEHAVARSRRAMPIPRMSTACALWRPATRRLAPAVLQKAGVKFALYSDGLDAPRDIAARREEGDRCRTFARGRDSRTDALPRARSTASRIGSAASRRARSAIWWSRRARSSTIGPEGGNDFCGRQEVSRRRRMPHPAGGRGQ